MAHFSVLHLYTHLLLSHRNFTVDKRLGEHLIGMLYILHTYTVEPQLSGTHLSGFLVNQTTETTALLE